MGTELQLSASPGLAQPQSLLAQGPAFLGAAAFKDGSRQGYKDPASYFRCELPHGKAFGPASPLPNPVPPPTLLSSSLFVPLPEIILCVRLFTYCLSLFLECKIHEGRDPGPFCSMPIPSAWHRVGVPYIYLHM